MKQAVIPPIIRHLTLPDLIILIPKHPHDRPLPSLIPFPKPVHQRKAQHGAKHGTRVIHVQSGNGLYGREWQEDDNVNTINDCKSVDGKAPFSKMPRSPRDGLLADTLDENEDDGNEVGYI